MQIINNTIRIYTSNYRKIDFILKYGYNHNKDIRCVAAGVADINSYLLFLATDDFFEALALYNEKQSNI